MADNHPNLSEESNNRADSRSTPRRKSPRTSEAVRDSDLTYIDADHAARWTVDDVAGYLRVSVKTIYKWRLTGDGPVGARIGKHLRYDPDDVVAWFESQKLAS
jgi:Helix-turn-helix domain